MIGRAALLALLAAIRRKPAEPEPRAVEILPEFSDIWETPHA